MAKILSSAMLAKNTYDLKEAVTGSALERFGQEAFVNQNFFFLETGCKVLEEGTGGCGWMWGAVGIVQYGSLNAPFCK